MMLTVKLTKDGPHFVPTGADQVISAGTRHHVPFRECPRAEQAVMHSSQ